MTIIYLTLAWAAGIILGQNAPEASLLLWWGIVLVAVVGAILLRKNHPQRIVLLCVAVCTLGLLRINAVNVPPGPDEVASTNGGGWREFEGVVIAEPDVRDRHVNLRVAADTTTRYEDTRAAHGVLLAQAPRYGGYAYGDRVRVSGTPLTPPEFDDFSYRDYLARQGIYTLVPNAEVEILGHGYGDVFTEALLSVKGRAQDVIAGALPEPQASLLTGILLGIETGISPEVREAFNDTGASHVIAISGFNMTLIASLLSRVLMNIMPTRKKTVVGISAIAILIYTLFVGADPAVVRAAIMSSLLIIAPLFRRKTYVPASLAFAALVMTALDPFVLWDVGFQLSFTAVMGLALFVTPVENSFRRILTPLFRTEVVERLLRILSEPLVVTLAAQITTLPLIIFYFGRLSLSSFAVNFLILPVQTPLLLLGGLATLIGLVAAPLAQPFYWAALVFLTWTVDVVRLFARIPGGSFDVGLDDRMVALFFLAILLWAILRGTRPAWLKNVRPFFRSQYARVVLLGTGAIVAVLIWSSALSLPDGLLHVHFLDSGHSNAVLIRTPDGSQILVDGGRYPTRLLTALGDHLPFWDREVELLIVTQPKNAQIAAIPAALERYAVGQALSNGQSADSENVLALESLFRECDIDVLPVIAGHTIETADGVRLEVLHPQATPDVDSEPNAQGMVLRLSYGETSFLLTPDLDESAEAELLASGRWLHGTVLQLPNHGSNSVSGEGFLDAVGPQIAVVQVDPGNRFGHPAEEVVSRLGDVPLYRTDEQGEVTFSTDGQTLWVTTEAD